jgi:hypothetical protein
MIFSERLFAQQYNFDSYTIKNGLIQSNVTSIVQDRDIFGLERRRESVNLMAEILLDSVLQTVWQNQVFSGF